MKEVLDKMQTQSTFKRNHEIVYAPKSKAKKLKCKMHGHNYVLTRIYDNDLPIRTYACTDCGRVLIRTNADIYDIPMYGEWDKFQNRMQSIVFHIFSTSIAIMCFRVIIMAIRDLWRF